MQDVPLLVNNLDHANNYHGDARLCRVWLRNIAAKPMPMHIARWLKPMQSLGMGAGDVMSQAEHASAWKRGTASPVLAGCIRSIAPVPEQLVYIINHAEDKVIVTDLTFVPILKRLPTKSPM